jgi:hypothetical protein
LWRSQFARVALDAVERDLNKFGSPENIAAQVAYLLGDGLPWLWANMWDQPQSNPEDPDFEVSLHPVIYFLY